MRSVREAYEAFWNSFLDRSVTPHRPIQAYMSGYAVTRDAQGRPAPTMSFPYITFDLVRPSFADFTIATASIWDQVPANVALQNQFRRVDDVLSQVAEAVPEGGAILSIGKEGGMILYRSNPFIDFLSEPDDPSISRGIIRLIIKNYIP